VAVQGNVGVSTTAPKRVPYSVRRTSVTEPSACRTGTVTVVSVIGTTSPSYTYDVGAPGARVSSK